MPDIEADEDVAESDSREKIPLIMGKPLKKWFPTPREFLDKYIKDNPKYALISYMLRHMTIDTHICPKRVNKIHKVPKFHLLTSCSELARETGQSRTGVRGRIIYFEEQQVLTIAKTDDDLICLDFTKFVLAWKTDLPRGLFKQSPVTAVTGKSDSPVTAVTGKSGDMQRPLQANGLETYTINTSRVPKKVLKNKKDYIKKEREEKDSLRSESSLPLLKDDQIIQISDHLPKAHQEVLNKQMKEVEDIAKVYVELMKSERPEAILELSDCIKAVDEMCYRITYDEIYFLLKFITTTPDKFYLDRFCHPLTLFKPWDKKEDGKAVCTFTSALKEMNKAKNSKYV